MIIFPVLKYLSFYFKLSINLISIKIILSLINQGVVIVIIDFKKIRLNKHYWLLHWILHTPVLLKQCAYNLLFN